MNFVSRPIKGYNPWLVKFSPNRGKRLVGVMIHATRSGRSEGDDGPGTENWASNPNNRQPGTDYGSFWDELIFESGERVYTPGYETQFPSWCAGYGDVGTWAASDFYYQIEVAQGRATDPFTGAQIESLAQRVAELSIKHNFEIKRIPFLEQKGVAPQGICTHEDSANGKKLGKSDPGPMFPWDRFLQLTRHYRSMNMLTEDDIRRIFREEWSAKEKEAGAGFVSFVRNVTNRIDAIHDGTKPAASHRDQLAAIHEATDLTKYPLQATPGD